MKIAFATQDRKHVDAHFGWAKNIAIYDVSPSGINFSKKSHSTAISPKTATKINSRRSSRQSKTARSCTSRPSAVPAPRASWRITSIRSTRSTEREAADRFGQLADAMSTYGNIEVGKLFRRLSDYSRLHLAEAQARAGYRDIPPLKPHEFDWPDMESPETAAIWAADPFMGREQALQIALAAESAGLAYYTSIFETTEDLEIRVVAKEFVEEESAHVAELQNWIAYHQAGRALPVDGKLAAR